MDKGYSQIELTDEEIQSLNETDESTVSQNTEKSEADNISVEESNEVEAPIVKGETETEDDRDSLHDESTLEPDNQVEVDDFDGLEIDGQKFDRETVLKWRDDSSNKSDWSKSNTERAQKLSKWNKLAEKIDGEENFLNHIKDYFFDDPEAIKALGLDGELTMPEANEVSDMEIPSHVESRLDALEKVEGERLLEHRVDQLDDVLVNLEKQFPEYIGEHDQLGEFLDFALVNSEKFVDNGLPNLERAFREWSYGQMQEKLNHYKKLDDNSKRNEGKVIGTAQVGAKEVKTPKKYSNWKDISMDDPDIAKYFDDK